MGSRETRGPRRTSGSWNSLRKKPLGVICAVLSLVFLAAASINGWAALSVAGNASPSTINMGQNVTITVSWNGGTAGASYSYRVTVTKPSAIGQAYATLSRLANSTGGGVVAVQYPQPTSAWTLVTGTVNTDVEGVYSVTVDKTAPNPVLTGVASTSFTVTHVISVAVLSPSPPSVSFNRGNTVTITASLVDASGQPVTSGTATATTPQSTLSLPATTTPGTFSAQYQVQLADPLGTWNITVSGTMPGGNYGSRKISATILSASLIVTSLSTFNAQGTPTADFSPGDSMYATFRIAYSSTGFLQEGSFKIQVRNPSGGTVTPILTTYDPNRNLFYTPSGFQVSLADPAGTWQLVIPANSLNDTYGNTGPSTEVDYRFQVQNSASSVLNLYDFALAALVIGGGLAGAVVLRRFNDTTAPFNELFKLTGGEIQSPASLMVFGDAGAGTTTLGLQLLYRDLLAGKPCGLLSYDAFPSEMKRRMRDMDWDITSYLANGNLSILDVYSSLAGVEGAAIQDPTDFTEVSIQVTGMIERAKGPITLLLDSVTPIFNAASAKDCINFLQVVAAKVKNSGGIFIFTATKGSIPEDARLKIESLADGVIELSLVKKAKSLARFLMVKKMSGRQISSVETRFEIVTGKGLVLVKQRIPIAIFSRK